MDGCTKRAGPGKAGSAISERSKDRILQVLMEAGFSNGRDGLMAYQNFDTPTWE